jgi:hypothetical protein
MFYFAVAIAMIEMRRCGQKKTPPPDVAAGSPRKIYSPIFGVIDARLHFVDRLVCKAKRFDPMAALVRFCVPEFVARGAQVFESGMHVGLTRRRLTGKECCSQCDARGTGPHCRFQEFGFHGDPLNSGPAKLPTMGAKLSILTGRLQHH